MSVDDPDLDHVRRIAIGDGVAARALVDKYGDRLMAVAYRMVGSREAAEDIVQEAFIRMWRHAAKWRPDRAQFGTWLHRVTINLCYDRLRKASTRYERTAGDEMPEIADGQVTADMTLEQGERSRALGKALERLPDRQKTAVVLCHFEEMSNAEAASIMDVSVTAIESLLARARRTLKGDAQLREDLSDEPGQAVQSSG